MNTSDKSVVSCRLCQHYNPEGRRGGFCEKLDVPVSSSWEACRLATHPFEAPWLFDNELRIIMHESSFESVTMNQQLEIPDRPSVSKEVVMRSLSFSEN
jgi:hypothetical protein